jgi:hypothetical protein
VLLLGEGDFGFTRALLRRSSGLSLIATTLESEQQLGRVYPGVLNLLSGLKAIGKGLPGGEGGGRIAKQGWRQGKRGWKQGWHLAGE